ncbi:MAG: ABC transporter ATP-binding protein [Tunicatimonas sp.]
MRALLQVNQLTHRYNKALSSYTIRGVSFSVPSGQVCAIVGASGSGKTTLLRLVSGILDAEQGAVLLSGQPVTGPSQNLVPGHPDIRTVFQDFALAPNLNVYNNIAHSLRAYRRDYRESRTRDLINRFQLQGREDQLPAALSGGEKQRVALARALAEEPALLLLDEPFSQVDPPLKNQLMNEVIDILKETSGTALFVTHDARDALAWSNQVVVLRRGEVVQQGSPPQIYEQPTDAYVAQLMGECSLVPIEKFCQWFPRYPARQTKLVGVRPEHVRLSSEAEQSVRGQVIRVNYRGSCYKLSVRTDENVHFIVHSLRKIEPNTPINLRIEAEKAVRFTK